MNELNAIIQRLINGEADDPEQLSKDLLVMSANLFNVGQEVTAADIAYVKKWNEERIKHKTDKSCDMAIKAMPEYAEWEKKKNAYKMIVDVIRSAKKRLMILSEEKRNY